MINALPSKPVPLRRVLGIVTEERCLDIRYRQAAGDWRNPSCVSRCKGTKMERSIGESPRSSVCTRALLLSPSSRQCSRAGETRICPIPVISSVTVTGFRNHQPKNTFSSYIHIH
jgi:hypothetical protein